MVKKKIKLVKKQIGYQQMNALERAKFVDNIVKDIDEQIINLHAQRIMWIQEKARLLYEAELSG